MPASQPAGFIDGLVAIILCNFADGGRFSRSGEPGCAFDCTGAFLIEFIRALYVTFRKVNQPDPELSYVYECRKRLSSAQLSVHAH